MLLNSSTVVSIQFAVQMIIDNSRLDRLVFCALLPIESRASYCRSNNAMKKMLPSTDNVKTIVVDCSMA